MFVQLVRFRTGLAETDVRQTIEARAPRYRDLPGLLQKYYIRHRETGEYGGIYVWEDERALDGSRTSELSRPIREAYAAEGESRVDNFEVMAVLRAVEAVPIPHAPTRR